MDSNAILSFRSPPTDRERVTASPSPVLELTYAQFYLDARVERIPPDKRAAWAVALLEDDPDFVADLRASWPEAAPHELLMVAAVEFDYVLDATPERYLADLPTLPARLCTEIERAELPRDMDDDEAASVQAWWQKVVESGAAIDESAWRAATDRLRALWERLEPAWRHEGRIQVEEACEAFRSAYAREGDVLEALPAHHFMQFERAAAHIRDAARSKRVVVVPLYHASDGGLGLEVEDVQLVGYGLQSERAFEAVHAHVAEVARAAKALGDPTRLMMLTLIARYGKFALTVGDLASQLDVSQPTVSGHLRQLRELGLVDLTKKGTKSYYHLDEAALRDTFAGLEELLLR